MKNQIKNYGNIIALFLMFSSLISYAQVGIGTSDPDDNSSLDLRGGSTNNKGFVLPLALSTEPFNPSNPKGTLLYNETDSLIYYLINPNSTPQIINALSPWFYNPAGPADITTVKNVKLNADNIKLGLGLENDLQLWHDGTDNYIRGLKGQLKIEATTAASVAVKGVVIKPDGATELYHNNVLRLVTTAAGVTVTSNVTGNLTGNVTGNVTGSSGSCTGNAATASAVAYSGLTGTVPTWNQNTSGNAATATSATTAATVTGAAQTAITSVGTLTSLKVSGNVGIGTPSPAISGFPAYPLHVYGSASFSWAGNSTPYLSETKFYLREALYTWVPNSSTSIGIKAESGILCDYLYLTSDERTKDIIGISNSKEDLSTLLSVEVTDYKKKDKIQYGEKRTKKLIAQQVKSVFPEAVSFQTDVVPDIYKLASIKDGYIALETDLEKGDRVKLIFEEDEQIVEVVKTNKNGFFIDNEKEGKVFVYGIEVDDFHVVDYDAISMLNVSATQELHKIITSQQKIIQNLKNQLSSQATKLEETKINQLDFEARLKSLETEDSITSSNKE
jgi:hypothetical protein